MEKVEDCGCKIEYMGVLNYLWTKLLVTYSTYCCNNLHGRFASIAAVRRPISWQYMRTVMVKLLPINSYYTAPSLFHWAHLWVCRNFITVDFSVWLVNLFLLSINVDQNGTILRPNNKFWYPRLNRDARMYSPWLFFFSFKACGSHTQ